MRAEPSTGWIEKALTGPWEIQGLALDLRNRDWWKGRGSARTKLRDLQPLERGTLYLPAVDRSDREFRDEVEAELNHRGVATLCQRFPEEAKSEYPTVVDLTPWVLDPKANLPKTLPGHWCLWPLVPGVRDQIEDWSEWAAHLQKLEVRVLQPIAVGPHPKIQRQLVERWGEEKFEAIFHGDELSERTFSAVVAAWDLLPFADRPVPPKEKSPSILVAALRLAAEFAFRLEEPQTRIQGFLRAARWVEDSKYDVLALVRDDQIKAIPWIEEESRALMEAWVEHGRSEVLDELQNQYLKKPYSSCASP